MNRKIFIGLVVFMSVSILGIIFVQLVWINNAVKVKNELFNHGVNEALTNSVKKLEDLHNFGVVSQMAFNDSTSWTNFAGADSIEHEMELHVLPAPPLPHRIINKKAPRPLKVIKEIKPGSKNARIEVRVLSDSNALSTSSSFVYSMETDENETVLYGDTNEQPNELVIIKHDTILSEADSLYQVSIVKIDSVLTRLDTIHFEQPNFSRRVKQKAFRLKNMATQVVDEIYQWDVKELDLDLIQEIVRNELNSKNIPIAFDLGVLNNETWNLPETATDTVNLAKSNFRVPLYPNDIFQKNLILALFFPERDSFIYRSLNLLLIASFLFSMFILMAFVLSIYYILRQKKISEMKSDFINNMTHEFKTPIATISVATDSITNSKVLKDPEKIRYFTGMIRKENARMNRQVEDILTIARLDRKDFEFNWETIDAHELVKDALQGILLQVEKQKGKIETKLDAENPVVTTDKIHFTNVIYNLLDNAIKYSPDAPEITIRSENQKKGIIISVVDRGIGMSKAVQAKIFERFYRQSSGNIHNIKGFGLGLSYVKAVMEANQGTISVQSEPGNGTKFELFLPFVRDGK